MNYWFSSDSHLGHKNILKYCGRTIFMTPQDKRMYETLGVDKLKRYIMSDESLDNMNKGIIKRWNERVKEDDIVFCIGDFCFRNSSVDKGEGIRIRANEWESKLNGKIIHIKGNHDKNNSTKTIIERLVIGYGGKRINLVHNPEHADLNFPINFCGHVHEKWQIKRIYDKNRYKFTDIINVGCDVWEFMPVKFEELMKRYYQWLRNTENKS